MKKRSSCLQRKKLTRSKKGMPVVYYDEKSEKQIVFMTEEGYKEMNDWWNGPPD